MVHLATKPGEKRCPKCKSKDIDIVHEGTKKVLICLDCGYEEFVD